MFAVVVLHLPVPSPSDAGVWNGSAHGSFSLGNNPVQVSAIPTDVKPEATLADANGRVVAATFTQCIQIGHWVGRSRSEEHTSELQSLMRISYAVFCLKKKRTKQRQHKYM